MKSTLQGDWDWKAVEADESVKSGGGEVEGQM